MKKYILLLVIITALTACNSNRPATDQQGDTLHAASNKTAAKTAAASAGRDHPVVAIRLKDDNLNAIYRYYTDLTESLTKEDVAGAKVAAAAIELGMTKVHGGEAVASSATAIIDASAITVQRDLYAKLNDSFISLLKKTGVASGDLYILHCPMARNDKGAFWISSSKMVRNPYYGEQMLNCGSVTEMLK